MNRQIVEELLAGHGEGKLVLSHRIHGTDFEVMVSLLQASGNTFVRDYCARAPILAGTNGLGDAVAQTFKAVHTAINGDLRAKPAGMSLFQFVSDPTRRDVFVRPFD
ncbi:hypothetical protein SAMN05414139_04894 [Burkholderia sp. D7]|jgi:hypothetical protein|uniref:Uncharacterized protein n=1 Tax=Caballeronia udeis TaxID=1232866 RepID=A0A158FP72_9BURK|nr:hypothetical protein [Caballeronia udeis]SAL21433.1 hypothetical protein AWB69_01430 [Caballeronia udeis]SOE92172.1 hypothetical protein SAMN05414139_04894 [Burkholderia sp. D7]